MHHPTRASLWAALSESIRTAGSTAGFLKSPSLRWVLLAAIALLGTVVWGPNAFHSLKGLWRSEAPETVPVLVAERYLQAFQVIKPEFARVRFFPPELVPPGALRAKNELTSEAGLPAYSSIIAIPEGQPITRALVAEAGKDPGLSALLRFGKVAVSFSAETSRIAGGWIRPGDTIAIFQTAPLGTLTGTASQKETRLLLGAAEVLAVDKNCLGAKPDASDKADALGELSALGNDSHILTILANPAEAAALVEAREKGPLSAVLRALGDDLPWTEKFK